MIEKLIEYIAAVKDQPFDWNGDHCCQFGGGIVEILTGENPLGSFTSNFENEDSARAYLKQQGGLARILTNLYGRSKQHGEPGYLAYSVFPDGSAVGVHMGRCAVFKGQDGLVEVPLGDCRFFKVV